MYYRVTDRTVSEWFEASEPQEAAALYREGLSDEDRSLPLDVYDETGKLLFSS